MADVKPNINITNANLTVLGEFEAIKNNIGNDNINMGGKYPSGVSAMAVPTTENLKEIKLEANNNHKFHGWLREANKDDLFTINRWSQLLTGARQPQGGIGADIMKNELLTWSFLKINGVQQNNSDFLENPFNVIAEFVSANIQNLHLYFKNPYEVIKDEFNTDEIVGSSELQPNKT